MPSVTYSSTRGGQTNLAFRDVVMQGLAHDRGLFVPDRLPTVSTTELESWRCLSYAELAVNVIAKFVGDDQVPLPNLRDIVTRSCAAFRDAQVTPLVHVGGHYVLELFHGPTFAFKDVALQMLGNFFEYFLSTGSNGGRLAVLGATSGDTGSAAIAGLRGKKGITCVILFPNGRVSAIQERQMTTVPDENVHCVAIDGTFDDCQDIVKASFNTPAFRDKVHLGAVNSINWCRVLAQTTYYYWSYLRVTDAHKDIPEVHFSVPTGNFGDVLAGYYAKQMGLPVGKLIVATNENDILHRFFTAGEYHRESIAETISPSMDICVSSNFERYLFHLAGNDASMLSAWMQAFEKTGQLTIQGDLLRQAQADFDSCRGDTSQTLATIETYHQKHQYVLCPHSAVGVYAIHQLSLVSSATVCLATAHEAKFPAAVAQVVEPMPPPPTELAVLRDLPTRRVELPNDLATVQAFVEECVFSRPRKWQAVAKHLAAVTVAVGVAAVALQAMTRRR
jgi:threonine synthase